ncbi:MAG: hypothetical protein U1A78_33900 [Polyangia bacterium]
MQLSNRIVAPNRLSRRESAIFEREKFFARTGRDRSGWRMPAIVAAIIRPYLGKSAEEVGGWFIGQCCASAKKLAAGKQRKPDHTCSEKTVYRAQADLTRSRLHAPVGWYRAKGQLHETKRYLVFEYAIDERTQDALLAYWHCTEWRKMHCSGIRLVGDDEQPDEPPAAPSAEEPRQLYLGDYGLTKLAAAFLKARAHFAPAAQAERGAELQDLERHQAEWEAETQAALRLIAEGALFAPELPDFFSPQRRQIVHIGADNLSTKDRIPDPDLSLDPSMKTHAVTHAAPADPPPSAAGLTGQAPATAADFFFGGTELALCLEERERLELRLDAKVQAHSLWGEHIRPWRRPDSLGEDIRGLRYMLDTIDLLERSYAKKGRAPISWPKIFASALRKNYLERDRRRRALEEAEQKAREKSGAKPRPSSRGTPYWRPP